MYAYTATLVYHFDLYVHMMSADHMQAMSCDFISLFRFFEFFGVLRYVKKIVCGRFKLEH